MNVEWGQDLDYSKEKVLTQDFDVPHFPTHYPKIAKPFYHRVDPSDDKYVLCPTSWPRRLRRDHRWWRAHMVRGRNPSTHRRRRNPREPYQFYIDVRSYGGVPHGGFGLGVDRVVSWLAGATHIREVIPSPERREG